MDPQPRQDAEDKGVHQYQGFDSHVDEQIKDLARSISRSSYTDKANDDADSSYNLTLARTLTHASQIPGQVPMLENESDFVDPRLNPYSDDFDSKFWIKNMKKIILSDPDYYKPASLGVAFKNLRCYGRASDADYQTNVENILYKYAYRYIKSLLGNFIPEIGGNDSFDILKPMEGLVKPGELTVVLGRPGAGCSTFLKTLACQTYGFHVDKESIINYDGLTPHDIKNHFRGDVVYCAETENHFAHLTVGDTLEFAAMLRTPQNRPLGVSRKLYAKHMTDVVMATYGLSHTKSTKVGNEFVRGVSGGERKRVSIAEVTLSQASIQCWDNSTRGLDSATALEFMRALKTSAEIAKSTPLVAIYQCSQDTYDLFDKVILLYEGYQIFFGSAKEAKQYFLDMGYHCPRRQTTADFLTSISNPSERQVEYGFEEKVPKTPEEFYKYWQQSPQRTKLLEEIDKYMEQNSNGNSKNRFHESHVAKQSKHIPAASPFTVSFLMQIRYVMHRNILRTKGDPSIAIFQVSGNVLMSLIISSIFYNLSSDTNSFYYRTSALFFAILFNAFSSILEIFSLYEARSIVEKHKKYALYHPAADALASIITEMAPKICTAIGFNLIYYFMINFRRNAGNFFFFLLVNFSATISMSHLFRTIGAATKSLSQAMTPASILLLALTIFTGFIIPTPAMLGWCRWINYINPIAYAFEALVANEFHNRQFECSQFVPFGKGYPTEGYNILCNAIGATPGSRYVDGDRYINIAFEYYASHKWRNWGIIVGFIFFLLFTYVIICEFNQGAMQKGEILLFQEAALRKRRKLKRDIESGKLEKIQPGDEKEDSGLQGSTLAHNDENNIFHWRNLTYEVKIKSETRLILNKVDGWVKPGQVTALMGASGAGKTTLLNALSDRLTSGVITDGVRMVNGRPLDASFQRSIGYVQQQDLHLQTSTVREALKFSAYLRQPKGVPKKERDEYVEYIISLLEMQAYADAVVGVAGEGLNVEQRKRLSIGVELVAKPKLLLFLDEPTSGLDSQTAWSICKLIRKLADNGQAVLCTIHQPSAILMKEFDRLLFLQRGGETVYFGDLGTHFQTLINYFEKNGAPSCPPDANPVEWMLEVIGAAPGSHASQDYFQVWRNSEEYKQIEKDLDNMEEELVKIPVDESPDKFDTFATPFIKQYLLVTQRVFEQYWRTPSYTYSKITLGVASALFNGFAFFKANNSIQGLQNQMFSVFMFLMVFMILVHQYLPHFKSQRDLYEVRERPSRTFSWLAFITAQITAEIPWNIFIGTLAFLCWYYPIGFFHNAALTGTAEERGAFMWFTIVMFYVYTSTMGQWCISFMEVTDNAANLNIILFTICLAFCGVLVSKDELPGFWIFMYRCNPYTYLVSVMLSVGLYNTPVKCAEAEILRFLPPANMTCAEYMKGYMNVAGGYLVEAGEGCGFCSMANSNVFLKKVGADYTRRGRDIGIFIAFICVNILGTLLFYYIARVPRTSRQK
ncbi:ABC-2 type transporter-domain-containing protein [Scheffersomyces xylosifermentans]|uniref:ABC-2 type transporter-domain-containing protein n=1 Tax=Scheffersomyces xylosifermentans TaxID=1304137 RepID=UPI00315D29C9